LQENYSDFVYVYTEGSKTAEKAGSGVYIQCNFRNKLSPPYSVQNYMQFLVPFTGCPYRVYAGL